MNLGSWLSRCRLRISQDVYELHRTRVPASPNVQGEIETSFQWNHVSWSHILSDFSQPYLLSHHASRSLGSPGPRPPGHRHAAVRVFADRRGAPWPGSNCLPQALFRPSDLFADSDDEIGSLTQARTPRCTSTRSWVVYVQPPVSLTTPPPPPPFLSYPPVMSFPGTKDQLPCALL